MYQRTVPTAKVPTTSSQYGSASLATRAIPGFFFAQHYAKLLRFICYLTAMREQRPQLSSLGRKTMIPKTTNWKKLEAAMLDCLSEIYSSTHRESWLMLNAQCLSGSSSPILGTATASGNNNRWHCSHSKLLFPYDRKVPDALNHSGRLHTNDRKSQDKPSRRLPMTTCPQKTQIRQSQ